MMSLKSVLFGALNLALISHAMADTYYVDSRQNNSGANGSKESPFRNIAEAIKLVDGKGGEVQLAPGSGPYRENVVIRKGGSPESPLILDGNGATINLGEDVTDGPWADTGNGWVLERPVEVNDRFYVATLAFVNGLPVYADHPKGKAPGAWHGGSAHYDDQKRLVLIFPKGLSPQNSAIVLPGPSTMACCIGLSGASNITIRNLSAVFSGNDGFNCHGNGQNVVFENVKALFNGDQGISSHESYQVVVQNAEIAFNGTFSGGVTDINYSNTTYRNVRIHQNRNAAFSLSGARHLLDHVVSFGNPGGNLPKPTDKIEIVECNDLGAVDSDKTIPTITSDDQKKTVANDATFAETDRLNRFLQNRPPKGPVTFTK